MPLQLPNLDDRDFEQLLAEAQRRIPVHTPEWTNFGLDSDPGITIVQLFAFLTENLIYRANRIPERNRLKFLQLLDQPLQPATPADGLITINNERGPLEPLPLNQGVVVSAGSVDFLTREPVNVLPIEAQIYYKRKILSTDPDYAAYEARYEAIRVAEMIEETEISTGAPEVADVKLDFYETTQLPLPTPGNPNPVLNLETDTIDQAIYIALLAPKNVAPADVREEIANQTLSIGVVPALDGEIPPLPPRSTSPQRESTPNLIYEIADTAGQTEPPIAQYARLNLLQQPDVLTAIGIVQVQLPDLNGLETWSFSEPLDEGTGDFPPKLEDEQVQARLITWIRLRLPAVDEAGLNQTSSENGKRLTWVGINASQVTQAVPIVNELLGQGSGEPDQVFQLANTPVINASIQVVVEDENSNGRLWRLTDDLLAAREDDEVFTLDSESGVIRFGDGLRGSRPQLGRRILTNYQYGGGLLGNVGIGAINASRDVRLQGGYKLSNPIPTSGGALGESVAESERNIPRILRHRDRVVTLQDFEDVVKRTPGVDVGRVEILPLFLPSQPDRDASGVVTVVPIPKFDPIRPFWPSPDRLFLRRICDYLEPRRLVTTEIYVRGPTYVPVYISVGIQVRAGHFPDVVRQTVSERLNAYLSALPPLGGSEGRGWPLNKRLIRKDLEAVVTRVPGVDFVNSLQLGLKTPQDGPEHDLFGLELPMLVGLSVREGEAESLDSVFAPTPDTDPTSVKVVPVPVIRAKC